MFRPFGSTAGFGAGGDTPILFYSRRIGLEYGRALIVKVNRLMRF